MKQIRHFKRGRIVDKGDGLNIIQLYGNGQDGGYTGVWTGDDLQDLVNAFTDKEHATARERKQSEMFGDVRAEKRICYSCKGDVSIRNPTGHCDHLYYPENVTVNDEL